MHKVSSSSKRINPEQVNKDNSDLWRYSTDLFSALRKEKFSKANPEAFIDYLEATGDLVPTSPYDRIDLKLDIEKFQETLTDDDLDIFKLLMVGMVQREIAEVVGLSQASISKRLKALREKFKEFYEEE